ncbi:MAG: hypothetical protein NTY07_21955, partial [Bacteroidia bacterium]|nr:hypothetical protein [Bacteroidia bacterium]
GRNFAASFLQIPPRNGHPCSWLMVGYTTYPHNGLAPSSYSPCTAHKGKEAIRKQYASFPRKAKLDWAPDFADVSASGDLGYTYGKYTLTSTDSIGNITQSGGIFHTVWKRQPDGQWRFVWD